MIEDIDVSPSVPRRPDAGTLWLGPGRLVATAIGGVLGVALVLGVSSPAARSVTPANIGCAAATRLVSHPNDPVFTGAPLGPLLLRNFPPDATQAVITEYKPLAPTKVVTIAVRPFERPLTLTGYRCSDRHLLRFAWTYPFPPPFGQTPSPSVFESAGELAPVIQPMTTLPASGVFSPAAPAYFLFTSSGMWLIELHDGHMLVGRAAVAVGEP